MAPQLVSTLKKLFKRPDDEIARGKKNATTRQKEKHDETTNILTEIRRCIAEFYGTFAITFVSGLGPTLVGETRMEYLLEILMMALAMGLILTALIYSVGQVSGCHVNPVVTLAFYLRGVFTWWRVPLYWVSQFAGGFLAAAFLWLCFSDARDAVGATTPTFVTDNSALGIEIIVTFFLVFTILNVSERGSLVGVNAALAVGAAFGASALVSGSFTGASMNPARSFGPAVVAGGTPLRKYWIYLVGPIIGSLIASLLAYIFNTHPNLEVIKGAAGDGHSHQKEDGEEKEEQSKGNVEEADKKKNEANKKDENAQE